MSNFIGFDPLCWSPSPVQKQTSRLDRPRYSKCKVFKMSWPMASQRRSCGLVIPKSYWIVECRYIQSKLGYRKLNFVKKPQLCQQIYPCVIYESTSYLKYSVVSVSVNILEEIKAYASIFENTAQYAVQCVPYMVHFTRVHIVHIIYLLLMHN